MHGCTVEDDCLIGMHATVLNGARIGAGSLVAAGTVVLEGTVIPPRSLVAGVPGKVRRALTDAEYDRVVANAQIYLGRSASTVHRLSEGVARSVNPVVGRTHGVHSSRPHRPERLPSLPRAR